MCEAKQEISTKVDRLIAAVENLARLLALLNETLARIAYPMHGGIPPLT